MGLPLFRKSSHENQQGNWFSDLVGHCNRGWGHETVGIFALGSCPFICTVPSVQDSDGGKIKCINTNHASGGEIVNVSDTAELGFGQKYFPFSLSENMHPKVAEAKTMTWIGSICLGGIGAWIGSVISLDDKPSQSDALVASLFHELFELASLVFIVTIPLVRSLAGLSLEGNCQQGGDQKTGGE